MNRFFDDSRPPQGSWHYFEKPGDVSTFFQASTEAGVIERVKRLRVNNGTFVSDLDIQREAWEYWCGREPQRCGLAVPPAVEAPLAPREITKELFGPIIWRALNLHAVQFDSIGQAGFLRFVGSITALMTCPECIHHWRQVIANARPEKIESKKEACLWAWAIHEHINAILGKPPYKYDQAVREYGFPLL